MDRHFLQAKWYQEWFAADTRAGVVAVLLLCVAVGGVVGALIGLLGPLYGVAAVAAAAVGLIMLRSVYVGLIAAIGIICLLPFAAIPLPIGFSPTFLDVALIAVYVVWLLRLARRKQRDFIATPVAFPLLLFIILAIVAFIAGLAHARPTASILRRFAEVIMALGLFYVVVNIVRTKGHLDWILRAIILAGFAAAFLGVVLYYLPEGTTIRILSALGRFNYPTGADIIQYVEDDPSKPMRAISTSVNPNLLGSLMILITSVTVAQLFAERPVLPRWTLWGMVPFMGLCLYLTYSRGSLAGLAVGLGVIGAVRYRKLLVLMAVAGLLLLLLPSTQAYIAHLIEGVRGEDLATQMRFGEYKDALILISRYPWLGVGFAGTPDIDLYIGVSNVYLMIAEQTGLIGLALFLAVMATAFAYVWRGWRARMSRTHEAALLGFVAALVGIMVGGLFDHYFFNLDFPHSVSFFWIYVGLAVVSARLGLEAPARE
ncbi:MAG: O-antigen ligase family protein [Chloroflexi bacterium]|nr:O-antigen ligase family protein [Chloroflexota bacterium]